MSDVLSQWEAEAKEELSKKISFADITFTSSNFEIDKKLGQILTLIELIRKKDEQLILASNYAYHNGARSLAESTAKALALSEQLNE